jgi:hypothetical protein
MKPNDLIEWMRENQILTQIFDSKFCHIQLVQRSSSIVKLFITEKELKIEELQMVWDASKLDDNTKLEVYKILKEVSSPMRNTELEFIVDKMG